MGELKDRRVGRPATQSVDVVRIRSRLPPHHYGRPCAVRERSLACGILSFLGLLMLMLMLMLVCAALPRCARPSIHVGNVLSYLVSTLVPYCLQSPSAPPHRCRCAEPVRGYAHGQTSVIDSSLVPSPGRTLTPNSSPLSLYDREPSQRHLSAL